MLNIYIILQLYIYILYYYTIYTVYWIWGFSSSLRGFAIYSYKVRRFFCPDADDPIGSSSADLASEVFLGTTVTIPILQNMKSYPPVN